MATEVTTTVSGALGWVRLDGAAQLNAIGSPTYRGIADAIGSLEKDKAVRCVVIHGSGRVFSAGADISEIGSFERREQFHHFIEGFTDALAALEASRLPIIAAIHGAALGGGLELAMACDIRVATADAQLGLPEAKLGVLPGAGGTQRLPRLIPSGVALEMVMTGASISGERAHSLGLVNHLALQGSPLDVARELADTLAATAPQVPGATKRLLAETLTMDLARGIEAERRATVDLFGSADGREGFDAFRERRLPRFRPVG